MTSDLLELAERSLDRARPGEELEIYVARGQDIEIRAYEGEVESLSSATSAGVGVRVMLSSTEAGSHAEGSGSHAEGPDDRTQGARLGFAWAGSLEAAYVADAVAEARDNAHFATPDPHMVLAAPDGAPPAQIDVWRPSAMPMSSKVALALELERAVRSADPRIRTVSSADYGDTSLEIAVASTTGIRAATRRTAAFLSVSAIAGEGTDSQTGTGFSVGRSPEDLDVEHACADAVVRATRMLGARKGESARCDVVFDPRVVSTLIAVLGGPLSGEAVVKGRSFFAGRIGEKVAAPTITIVDDPTDARAYGASVYDAEGLACRRNVLVERGVLRGFVFDSVSARRAGTASTGSALRGGFAGTPGAGCRAMVLEPGTMTHDEILAAVGDGLYVQSVSGVHSGVNPISGDLSVGAEGLVVRGGELAEPVREITVGSTLQKMLQSVHYVGADLQWLPGSAAGQTVAFADMQLSGT